jgi:hypothetical protein
MSQHAPISGRTASEQITGEVTSWPGVQAAPGRRGEFSSARLRLNYDRLTQTGEDR